MKKKDLGLIIFFGLIFWMILIKVGGKFGGNKASGKKSSETLADVFQSLDTTLKNLHQGGQIKPSAAVQRKSFYNTEGKFESYYENDVPEEFLTDPKMFTNYNKLKESMYYNTWKLNTDLKMEQEEFERTHDFRGRDKEKYQKLLENHERIRVQFRVKNEAISQEFKAEMYEADKGLR